jgi:pimeloyl-ACP methyl ester carboxylesterase
MPAVLVHGNPETPAIWGPMRALLARDDVVALQLPGFGVPAPPSFDASRRSYVDWLHGELEAIDGPIDLVGHDWGGALVVEVVIGHAELVRSWATDGIGLFDPDYIWHDMAQSWQSDAGEDAIAVLLDASVADRTAFYESVGMPNAVAVQLADAFDAEMARCILALYRSAAQPAMAEVGRGLAAAAARPGLAVVPLEDPYTGGEALANRAAAAAGARTAPLPRGHWWMLEDPQEAASTLESFWSTCT